MILRETAPQAKEDTQKTTKKTKQGMVEATPAGKKRVAPHGMLPLLGPKDLVRRRFGVVKPKAQKNFSWRLLHG